MDKFNSSIILKYTSPPSGGNLAGQGGGGGFENNNLNFVILKNFKIKKITSASLRKPIIISRDT